MKEQHRFTVERDGDFLLIRIPSIGPDAVTQARTGDEVQSMVLDYIAVTRDIPVDQIEIWSSTWYVDVFEALGIPST